MGFTGGPHKKKDGGTIFIVDCRKLNELTKKDSYPLPRVDTTLDALSGLSWFSTLDLKSGYWQVEVEEQDREKTAFTAGNGAVAVQCDGFPPMSCTRHF